MDTAEDHLGGAYATGWSDLAEQLVRITQNAGVTFVDLRKSADATRL